MIHLQLAIHAALGAGEEILKIYEKEFSMETKDDSSPLTEADKRSNEVILDALRATGIPIICEEINNIDYAQRSEWDLCWVIDPLDGTKEFIKRNGEFTVNIALTKDGLPVMGIVYLPVIKKLYFGSEELGSFVVDFDEVDKFQDLDKVLNRSLRLPIDTLPCDYTIVVSRSHLSRDTEVFIESCRKKYGDIILVNRGSSLKLCMVAEGQAHVYPRLAPTMEWDTAAGQAICEAVGLSVIDKGTNAPMVYNRENLLNNYFLVK